jgi:hypothetical protein
MRDIDIRRQLLAEMNRKYHLDSETRIVQELGLCQGIARIDIAVVNGSLHGYEIKSERDTLSRLPGQIDVYNRTLEFVTIVTAPNHADKVRGIVPDWWGVRTAIPYANGLTLKTLRRAKRNPAVVPFAMAQLLWREEALQVLEDHNLARGIRSRPREELWRRLASELSLADLGQIVRERLKCRSADWRVPAPPVSDGGSLPPSATS